MPDYEYAWHCYACLQRKLYSSTHIGDTYWGIERALNYLVVAIASGSLPASHVELDAALDRAIATGARLNRSHSSMLVKYANEPGAASAHDAVVATMEIERITSNISASDLMILMDTGRGYTRTEIAKRHSSTSGAIRTRLSRLRSKLAA